MILTSYRLPLPSDYDVAALRERIPSIGEYFDGRPGMVFKAFLVRDVADGSAANEYAPFYLWHDDREAAAFLWADGGFDGVAAKYGRPDVQTWLGGTTLVGPAHDVTPQWAARESIALPADEPPTRAATRLASAFEEQRDEPGLHSLTWGIDPRGWSAVVLRLYVERPADPVGDLCRVVYLSTNEALATSRA